MRIQIEKDSSTKVVKECTPEQAAAYAAQFPVHVLGDDDSLTPHASFVAMPIALDDPRHPDNPKHVPAKKAAAKKAAAKKAAAKKAAAKKAAPAKKKAAAKRKR